MGHLDIAQHFGASNCGRKPTLTAGQLEQVRRIAEERPGAFLSELADEIDVRLGVRAYRQTVGRWLRDLGITQKKSLHATAAAPRAHVASRTRRPGTGR